ncbi:HNH endonuclease [Staphylococcus felis]|uniref:HNH nuclease domain-containing protein n=1 Tax=Staphylococcus felis TaxID=46127 RepID=A0A3E0IKK8_9STAP|nr:HNH endonuclease [Staphylococcus felis]REH88586.1 hypothetical protein DOS83_14095 [Staphylococcus felis]
MVAIKDLSEHLNTIQELNDKEIGMQAIADNINVNRKVLSKWCKDNGIVIKPKVYRGYCLQCGISYKSTRHNVKYCSEYCKSKYSRNKYITNKETKRVNCIHCNNTFDIPKTQSLSSYKRKCPTCRTHYKHIGDSCNVYYFECINCYKLHLSKRKTPRKYCDDKCKSMYKFKRKYHKQCVECNKDYVSNRVNSKFCSESCLRKFSYRKQEINRRLTIKNNGEVDWNISIKGLIKRDGQKCYLCGNDVIFSENTNDDYYPSIEHVKPLSKGGTHTWDNVKIAHRKCNWEKGVNLIPPPQII